MLDVAQFWRDVSIVLQSQPGCLVCGESSEPEMAKDQRDTRHNIGFCFRFDLELINVT